MGPPESTLFNLDYVAIITDFHGNLLDPSYLGLTDKIGNTNNNRFQVTTFPTYNKKNGAHEFGHGVGLTHPNGYMYSSSDKRHNDSRDREGVILGHHNLMRQSWDSDGTKVNAGQQKEIDKNVTNKIYTKLTNMTASITEWDLKENGNLGSGAAVIFNKDGTTFFSEDDNATFFLHFFKGVTATKDRGLINYGCLNRG